MCFGLEVSRTLSFALLQAKHDEQFERKARPGAEAGHATTGAIFFSGQ